MIRSLFRVAARPPRDLDSDPGFAPLSSIDPGPDGLGVGVRGRRIPTNVVTANTVVKFLAGTQGALPRKIVERGRPGRPEVRPRELRHLWGRPNLDDSPLSHAGVFWTGLFASFEGWANGYSWTDRIPGTDDWRGVTGLHYMPPWNVHPFQPRGSRDVLYKLGGDRETAYSARDIMHVPGMTFDGIRGVTPVELSPMAHELSLQMETAGVAMFREGIRPSGVVSIDGEVDSATEREFQDSWAAKYAGARRFGVVPLLGKGAKWIQTTIPPADAQYLEGRAFQREEIVGLYAPGLPHHLLGWKSNASNFGTGIEAQGIHLVQFVLMDRLLAFEGMINDTLLPEELAFKFNVDGLLRGDSKQRTERMTRMRQWGVLSADDWLEFEDQAPRGIPDDYLSPKNVERLDADSGEALGAAAGPAAPGPPQGPPAPPQQPRPPEGRRLLTEARCTNSDCPSVQSGRRGALLATNVGTATLQCSRCKVRTRVRDGYALRDETDALERFLEELDDRGA